MDLMKMGADLLGENLKGVDSDALISALGSMFSGSDGEIDLSNIISEMNDKGLGSIVGSWLGDGSNSSISTNQVRDLLGSDKIAQVASQLNSDEGSVLESLSAALPQLIDQSSSGGSLLDSIGGIEGALDMANKFLK